MNNPDTAHVAEDELDDLLYEYRQLIRQERTRKVLNGERFDIEAKIRQFLAPKATSDTSVNPPMIHSNVPKTPSDDTSERSNVNVGDKELEYRILEIIDEADQTSRMTTGLADEKYIAHQEALIKGFTYLIQSTVAQAKHAAEVRGRLAGLEEAKCIVIRRTEIPKDATNPTRDTVVIMGEACADAIEQCLAQLKASTGDA